MYMTNCFIELIPRFEVSTCCTLDGHTEEDLDLKQIFENRRFINNNNNHYNNHNNNYNNNDKDNNKNSHKIKQVEQYSKKQT